MPGRACCCWYCCCWYCCCACHICCCDCGATKAGPVRPAVAAWYLSSRVSGRPVSAAKGSPPGETGDFGVSWGGGGGGAGAAGASSPLPKTSAAAAAVAGKASETSVEAFSSDALKASSSDGGSSSVLGGGGDVSLTLRLPKRPAGAGGPLRQPQRQGDV